MNVSRRALKVAREIRESLASLFLSGLKMPLPGLVSVWHVDVSDNLRSAKVFIHVGTGADETEDSSEVQKKKVEDILESQKNYIQRHIAKTLPTKFCPVLRFVVGHHMEAKG